MESNPKTFITAKLSGFIMKFIRVHGRVVPIKEGNEKYGAHKTQIKLGAAASAAHSLALGAVYHKKLKTAIGFAAASGIASGVALGKRINNSIDHGRDKKSFIHGMGRFLTLSVAKSAGTSLGNFGLRHVAKAAKTIRASGIGGSSSLRKGSIKLRKLSGGSYGK